MKTIREELEPTKVKLTVEVEPERVSAAFDEAARHLAQQVQVKGFRKGKAPRRLIEARLGKGAVAQHAMEDALGAFYAEAVRQEELQPVAQPEIDLQRFDENEGAAFEVTVEVRPDVEPPDHEGINVAFPEWEVTDDEVRQQLDEMRERFAELEETDRPAAVGDYVTLDLYVTKDDEPIEDAAAEDAMYEVGSGGVTPKLDDQLAGSTAGHVLEYTDTLPPEYPEHGGEEVDFRVLVKDVRRKQLPPLDDDFAQTASEFETLDELEGELRSSLRRRKLSHAQQELRARVLEAYLALVDVPLPEGMVQTEVDARIEQLERQANQYGLELDQLLEMQGTDLESHRGQLEDQSRQTVKAQLVLEALAEKLEVQVESADLEREIRRHASQQGVEAARLAEVISEQGSLPLLIGDVVRRKALDALVEAAQIEDEPDEAVIEELFGAPPDAEDGATASADDEDDDASVPAGDEEE